MTQRPTRESQAREEEWKEPNDLDVPTGLKSRLKSQGYETRWIRIFLENEPDAKNVMLKEREGYTFVTVEEAPEWANPPSVNYGRHGNLIVVGDLALAKIPYKIAESRRRAMTKRARDQMQAVDRMLYENSGLNRTMPIRNDSRSQIFKGRLPAEDLD